MVGEVGFAGCEEAFYRCLQFVVDPKSAHGVVYRRVNHHRCFVWVLVDDFLVHLEEVAVACFHFFFAQSFDCGFEVEVNGLSASHSVACVATFFGCSRGYVSRNKVSESRVASFQVVVSVFFGYVGRFQFACSYGFCVFFLFRYPDSSVITQALAHQGEFGLIVAVYGYAGRVDLHVARVGEACSFFVALPCCRAVGVHGVGREVIYVAVASRGEYDGVSEPTFELSGLQVSCDDASCFAIDEYHVHHFSSFVHLHGAVFDLFAQSGVGSQ